MMMWKLIASSQHHSSSFFFSLARAHVVAMRMNNNPHTGCSNGTKTADTRSKSTERNKAEPGLETATTDCYSNSSLPLASR